jgi:predicted transposase YbfD/YdcC
MTKSFLEHFERLEDPRVKGLVTYPLAEILLGALIGVLCGAEDWEDVVLICEQKLDFLKMFLPYDNGIASPDTFQRVFDLLDSKVFATCFAAWIGSILGPIKGVVAIDGKTIRGAKQNNGRALHVLSAYAHEAGLVIGQRCVDQKSNEITAIPDLLNDLAIKGAIVTIDAMGTQKDITAAIIRQKADYVLALKGNQSALHDDVRLFFADAETASALQPHRTLDAGHGRIDERICRATEDIAWLREQHPDWVNLRSIAAVTALRTNKKTGQTSRETRFYISSLPAAPQKLLAATRAHWSIENNLHWMLDVALREDACPTRKDHAALNLATIRKMVLALCRKNPEKIAIKRKIKKAALNNGFLANLLR